MFNNSELDKNWTVMMRRKQKNSQQDLVIFGDSLCTDFYVTKPIPTMLRARICANNGGWQKYIPFTTRAYSTVSGDIHPSPPSIRWRSKFLLGAKHFRHKIREYVKNFDGHPKGYFIWIGHNNLDWSEDIKKHNTPIDHYIKNYPKQMTEKIFEELFYLIKSTPNPKKTTPLIVSGLINFEDFFKLRQQILVKRNHFRHWHMSEVVFPSIKTHYQTNLLNLWRKFNDELKQECEKYQIEFWENNYKLIYSDEFTKIPIQDIRILNENDAWHLSEYGREYFANYIKDHLKEILEPSQTSANSLHS